MALRQAGFTTVMCVSERFANDLLTAAFANAGPQTTFAMASPIVAGGAAVQISGPLRVLPPTVTLSTRPDDLIGVNLRFAGELSLTSPVSAPTDVEVEFGCSLLVGVAVQQQGDRFFVGLDLTSAVVTDADLWVIAGSMGSIYGNALHSPAALAALTNALQAIPPALLQLTPNGVPATRHIAPPAMPCGASLFEPPALFDAAITVARIVPRPIDGALVVGIDLDGAQTHGNRDALTNLLKEPGPRHLVQTNNIEGPTALSERAADVRGTSVGISVNPQALSSLVANVLSPVAHNSFLDCHVALEDLAISFGRFRPPMSSTFINGATLHVGVRFHDRPGRDALGRLTPGGASVRADVSMTLGVYMQRWEGTTAFVSQTRPSWRLKAYTVDIDLPWWLTFGLVVSGLTVPLVALPALVVVADVMPTVISNLEAEVRRRSEAGINGAAQEIGLSNVHDTVRLAGLAEPLWDASLVALSLTEEGVEAFAVYTPQGRPTPARDATLNVVAAGQAVRDGGDASWPVRNANPIPCSVELMPGVADFADPTLRVKWEVRRNDNGDLILNRDDVYRSMMALALGLASREISIDHASPELEAVERFDVHASVYQQLHGRQRQLGASHFRVHIADRFDRHHPFVHWPGRGKIRRMLFPGGVDIRRSAIHRTAIPGRCEMLDRASFTTTFEYLDELPFPKEDLIANRDKLCDYCFFGGPDKSEPRI